MNLSITDTLKGVVTRYNEYDPNQPQPFPTHLRVFEEEFPPYVFVDGEGKDVRIWGPMSRVLEQLSQALGFSYDLNRPLDYSFGIRTLDGNYTGMVLQLAQDNGDVILGPLAITEARKVVIDYTIPFVVDYLGILQSRPSRKVDPQYFIKTLDWKIWLVLAACLFVVAGIFRIFTWVGKYHDNPIPHNPRVSGSLYNMVWALYACVLLQGDIDATFHRDSYRVLIGTWSLVSFVVGSAFADQMIALLAIPVVKPIESTSDLTKFPNYGVIMEINSAATQIFFDSTKGDLYEIWEMRKRKGMEVSAQEMSAAVMNGMLDDGYVMIAEAAMLKKFMSQSVKPTKEDPGKCSLYLGKKEFIPLNFATGLNKRKSKVLSEPFNQKLYGLVESGIWKHMLTEEMPNLERCMVHPSKEKFETIILSMYILQIAFYIYLGGMAIALAVLLIELFIHWCFKKEE